jgi:hypothetical protein
VQENLAHAAGGPSGGTPFLRPRRQRTLFVQRLRDAREAPAGGRQLEDAADDRALGFVDLPLNVRTSTVGAQDLDVVAPEDAATSDVPARALPDHREAYRDTFTVLTQGDHYPIAMIDRALGRELRR